MKKLVYLMVASVFLAAGIFGLDIKIMQLSIYRALLLLILLLFIIENIKNNSKIDLSFRDNKRIFIKFYFFWFIYSVFSIGWVVDYYSWFKAIFFIGSGFFCIIILSNYINNKKDFIKIFTILLFMIVMHNAIGWYELITGVYKFTDLSRIDKYNQFSWNAAARIPVSMFNNPNDYATLLVFGVFIAYINFENTKSSFIKLLAGVTITSSVLLIFKSNSRANMLGLIIGVIVLIYMKYFKRSRIRTLLMFVALPVFSVTFFKKLEPLYMVLSNKLQFNFSDSGGSDVIRLNLIKNGLLFLKETAGFGVGAGNIEHWMATKKLYYVGKITNMHNWWMEILVGYGIIVFILYLLVYIRMAKNLYSTVLKANDKFVRTVSLGLLCIMASFIISSLSSSSNITSEWLWLFWGIVIAFIGYIEEHVETK